MATFYHYHRLTNVWFQTNIVPTLNTRVELDNAGFATAQGNAGLISSEQSWYWASTSYCIAERGSEAAFSFRIGNGTGPDNGIPIVFGSRYDFVLDKTHLKIGEDVYSINATSLSTSLPFVIGGRSKNFNQAEMLCDGYIGDVRIYENDVLVAEYKPTINNGEYTFYDTVSQTFLTKNGSGTITPGPPVHTFSSDVDKLSFQSIQSSQNITITAETGWTATTNNSWISLSQNTGSSGETNITVTVADGSNDGSRVGKITFTDAEEYTFDVDVSQLKLGMKVYVNRYKVGSTNIVKQQRGEDNVKKMYMGNDLVYQKFAFSPKLSISVDSMEFKCSGDTAQSVTVNSNINWNYTTDANWLTLTKDGNTLSVLPSDYTSELEDRTATITITADNGDIVKTKTISVTQKKVTTWEPVDYVYTSSEAYVDTTIRPTTNTKFTVKLKQTGRNGGCTVGYDMSDTPITCENDNTDYRCFNYDRTNGFNWDFNSSRINGNISPESDGLIIATFGNNYIADKNGNKVATGSTQSSISTQRNVPIYINLDNMYAQIQQVTIYGENDVVLFDGHAADVDGDYGIYDTVSETLLKPTNGATVYKGTWS